MVECTGVLPVATTNITSLWTTSTVNCNAEKTSTVSWFLGKGFGYGLHKANDSNNLDDGEEKFGFTVSFDAD